MPAEKVAGTSVSLADLQATKKAKGSVRRAEKAMQKGQWAEAEKHLKSALSDSPQYATAWLRLGQV